MDDKSILKTKKILKQTFMDMLSKKSEIGMVHTVPDGMAPGSDTANLSVLGYDPKIYYSGRSPLEALSIGVPMTDTDIALRCNIVTISEEEGVPYEEQTIIDHSSSEISTEDCEILLEAVRKELENGKKVLVEYNKEENKLEFKVND